MASIQSLRRRIYKLLITQPKHGHPLLNIHASIRPSYTDADIFKLIEVDPDSIVAVSDLNPSRQYGAVIAGNWDKRSTDFSDYPTYDALLSYFIDDDKEPLRKHFEYKINNASGWGHSSMDDFDDRINELESLKKRIENNGYRTQRELLKQDHLSTKERNNESTATVLNECTVDIGRDGQFLFCGYGANRLSIAKILDLDKIPVIVAARHKEWQQVRDEIRQSSNYSISVTNHPDLQDLL